MGVYIERPDGNQYARDDATWFNVLQDGSLVVYADGVRILQYRPGTWLAVEIEEDEEEADA